MILLLLSICCSTGIYAIFKLFSKYGIDTFQAIVFNYFVAAGFGFWWAGHAVSPSEIAGQPWIYHAALVGILFIVLFYIMALTSQQFGVAVTSIASKMSMVIPAGLLIFIDPEEGLTLWKTLGIAAGMAAVVLASLKDKNSTAVTASLALPLVLFFGSGGLDFLLALVQRSFLTEEMAYRDFVPVPFAVAATAGTLVLLVRSVKGRRPIQLKNMLAGVVLGVVNYGSIYFVLRVIGSGFIDRSSAIPANNIGVVLLSTLVGFLVFGERLTAKNMAGVALAIGAIILLTFHG